MYNSLLKSNMVWGFLLFAVVYMSASSAIAVDWCDDFESYAVGANTSPNWHFSDPGQKQDNVVVNDVAATGNQSVKLYGTVGGCFGTVISKPLSNSFPLSISLAVRNGSESLSGCHPFRGEIELMTGAPWNSPSVSLLRFLPDGSAIELLSNDSTLLLPYSLNQWHEVEIHLWFSGDTLHGSYFINGVPFGSFSRDSSATPYIRDLTHLGLIAQEGTSWFDDVCVSSTSVDKLTFPSVSVGPCDSSWAVQPVVCNLSQPASGDTIPVRIPPNVTVDSISYQGLITETWDVQIDTILSDSGYLSVALANFQGLTIPAGQTTLFNILYRAPRQCRTDTYIHWDTALYNDIGRQLKFADTGFPSHAIPVIFDISSDSTKISGYEVGNIDNDTLDNVDITDLTMLIDHLFISFPVLCVNDAGNCDGDLAGNVDITDLTTLIDHIFINFLPLPCPGGPVLAKQTNVVSMESVYGNGRTTIRVQSDIDLRGVELTLTGDGQATPNNLLAGKLDLMSGMRNGKLRIGLADLDGGNTISIGKTNLVELDGNWQIEQAIVSDINHQSINALSSVSGSDDLLPAEYALNQNYPNPFNPSTSISFSLPVASNVKLDIFNMLGQNVTTLVDEYLEAGEHTATWNAGNSASGVYFYRLTAGDFVAKKKMILLK